MSFVIAGLDPAPFRHLFGASAQALAAVDAVRVTAGSDHGFPCRITLEDAKAGETLLLVNYEHLPVASPYRSRHAVYVREGAETPARYWDEIPEQLATRLISLRAFDRYGMMTNADVVEGVDLKPLIAAMFADSAVDYLHAHNAKYGCFAARIDRA